MHRIVHDGQGTQAQEVHLQKAQLFHLVLIELGGDHPLLADARFNVCSFVQLQGHQFNQGFRRNHHARRMGAAVTGQAFHAFGDVDHAFYFRVAVVHGPQVFCLQRPVQGNPQFPGHRLGHPVRLRQTDAQGPSYVPDRRTRLQCSEGDNQRHMVCAILADHIVQHFAPPAVAEIRINIGHADPFRIQEPFKQ